MHNIWKSTTKVKREGFTLLKVFFKTFKKEWIQILFLILLIVTLELLSPFITAYNINYIQNN